MATRSARLGVIPALFTAGVLLWPPTASRRPFGQARAIAASTADSSVSSASMNGQPPIGLVEPPLEALLDRAGKSVIAFEQQFSRVVGFERYRQEVHSPAGGELADLESEVFFVAIDHRRTWLTVRRVLTVNGQSVAEAADPLGDLLMAAGNSAGLRELADASARYNIGSVRRNFNDPTLALLFLAPAAQSRFRFSDQGRETVEGIDLHRVAFNERQRPTIVRDARDGRDAPSSGVLLIAEDGRVMRSELRVRGPRNTSSTINVSYGLEPRLEMMVPLLMEEDYRISRERGSGEVITGRAAYSNYRRFETGARILAPSEAPRGPR